MKQALEKLLRNNHAWADGVRNEDPQFFERLSELQAPKYLWIGCSDSRVPANQVIGLAPGEVFVHRNIANVMVHTDLKDRKSTRLNSSHSCASRMPTTDRKKKTTTILRT